MIAIIGAMDVEIKTLSALLENARVIERSSRTFYLGNLDGQEVIIVQAGIGKVNSAITTSILCENFDVEYVINVGVAGGVDVNPKSLVISSRAMYHDADATNFGYEIGQIPGEELFFDADAALIEKATKACETLNLEYTVGTVGTGDSFIVNESQYEPILKVVDDLKAVEMEGASIAQAASLYKKPFIIVRAISDVVGQEGQTTHYETFVQEAADNAANIVKLLIKK